MIPQDLSQLAAWHLRPYSRIGLTPKECEAIRDCVSRHRNWTPRANLRGGIEGAIEFVGMKPNALPWVKDIEHGV